MNVAVSVRPAERRLMSSWRRLPRLFGLCLGLSALSGCDPVYGISGSTIVLNATDDSCILSAIKETPGVKDVRPQTIKNEGILILGDGPVDNSLIRYFTYDVGLPFSPTFMIEDYYGGKTKYSNYLVRMNSKIPQGQLDQAMPVMRAVNETISRRCGVDLKNLTEGVI